MLLLRRSFLPLATLALSIVPFAVACSSEPADESDDDTGALIGGNTSGIEDDAVLALFRRGQPYCAATLVGQNVLVTALHCVSEIQNQGNQTIIGQRINSSELSVHMGTNPKSLPSAIVSKIVVPDEALAGPVPVNGNDIALLYVSPIDPTFTKIAPRRIGTRPVDGNSQVTVVGYNAAGVGTQAQLTRQRRDGVFVWAGAMQEELVRAELDNGQQMFWKNHRMEFTTETVACASDSGGPAFDAQGNLVGLVVGVVGQCVPGSLSVFTDVASHVPWLQKAIQPVTQGAVCTTDTQCGSAQSGRVCDIKTQRCMVGCRSGGTQCTPGHLCSAQGQPVGALGICRTTSGQADPSDPAYDQGPYISPEGAQCPGNPLCTTPAGPGATTGRACTQDSECVAALPPGTPPLPGTPSVPGATPGLDAGALPPAPAVQVCDIPRGRCLAGCRVATAGMCGTGYSCGAGTEDPQIGTCQIAQVTPPPGPPAAPPSLPSDVGASPPSSPSDVNASATGGADAGTKKKKAEKKGGCTVSAGGSSFSAFPIAFGLAALALRRRRRA